MSKYGHLMLPGVFQDKVTPDIVFTEEAIVQCYSRKNTFVGAEKI